ncbi:MAG: DUF2971 domain-containing protein [Nitrospirae bacterium]|nr:DUF2971 domain-containing protein [Nitrospirota bacterium]
MKLYKYIGPEILSIAFSKEGYVGLKCSYPKDYNDPFELFLTLDSYEAEAEIIAYYHEILGEVPQLPTTCFSKRPDVIPMWAHYAHQSRGFVIEIDESRMTKRFPDTSIDDVDYKDNPHAVELEAVILAYTTTKPRHTYLLQRAAFGNAYFTKSSCWSYESERRVILKQSDVSTTDSNMILYVPIDCVSSVIAAPFSIDEHVDYCKKLTERISCDYYEMKIGRSSITPYFLNKENDSFQFDGEKLDSVDNYCGKCGEPIIGEEEYCHWCSTSEDDKYDAAFRNPMKRLSKLGLLEGYLKGSAEIDKKCRT